MNNFFFKFYFGNEKFHVKQGDVVGDWKNQPTKLNVFSIFIVYAWLVSGELVFHLFPSYNQTYKKNIKREKERKRVAYDEVYKPNVVKCKN